MNALQLAQTAQAAGFVGNGLVLAIAIALAESGGDPGATGTNPGSVDRGLWQINSLYHAEVTDACAYDPDCCARAAYRISKGGSDWTPWSTYTGGAYQRTLGDAQAAVARLSQAAAAGASGSPPASLPAATPAATAATNWGPVALLALAAVAAIWVLS